MTPAGQLLRHDGKSKTKAPTAAVCRQCYLNFIDNMRLCQLWDSIIIIPKNVTERCIQKHFSKIFATNIHLCKQCMHVWHSQSFSALSIKCPNWLQYQFSLDLSNLSYINSAYLLYSQCWLYSLLYAAIRLVNMLYNELLKSFRNCTFYLLCVYVCYFMILFICNTQR